MRAGEANTVKPESIVVGEQGSWKSTVNWKFVAVVTPRGVTKLIVSVYSCSRAGFTDSNETILFGISKVIAAVSAAGNAGLIAIA